MDSEELVQSPCNRRLGGAAVAVAIVALSALQAGGAPPPVPEVTAKDRAAIIESIVGDLNDTYVFADVAEKMANLLRKELAAGTYDGVTTLPAFCELLTVELQCVSHDRHLIVRWEPPPPDVGGKPPSAAEERARELAELRRGNYCFERIEHLPGNVGYLKLDCLADAGVGGATAVAAMNFLAGSDALIFDLRDNGGGEPSMIQLINSYLFEAPTHLNSFYIRKGDQTEQFWTQAHVEGSRLTDVPVFVLTSGYTFSGGEEFAYNLKSTKRGTIVGETTGGGAHPVRRFPVAGYPVTVNVPFGRAINPITGTNWEGTGVAPDVPTTATAALDTAYVKALETVEAKTKDEVVKREVAWMREGATARLQPFAVAESSLRGYAGTYGLRTVTSEGGALNYQRRGRGKFALVPMARDLFVIPELDYFRVAFERDAGGQVVRLVGLYANGRSEPSDRTAR